MMWGQPRDPLAALPQWQVPMQAPMAPPMMMPPQSPMMMPPQSPMMAPMAAAVKEKPKFFDKDGAWRDVFGLIADTIAGGLGGEQMYGKVKMQEREQRSLLERELAREDREAGRADSRAAAELRRPIREKIGNDYVQIDPMTGTAQTLYRGPPEAPKVGSFAQKAADMRALGATPEQISRMIENETLGTPVAVDAIDAAGNTVRTYQRPGQMGAAPASTFPPGTVRNGFRFKGGDDADPANWEPVGKGGQTPAASGGFPRSPGPLL